MKKDNLNNEEAEVNEASKKSAKTFTKKQLIISILISVLAVVLICVTAVCIVNDFNPITYSLSIITNDEDKLIGKWQSKDAPGLSAYEFHEDGDYDSYISSFNFSGQYETSGDKLTLINTKSNEEIVYKYSVTGDTLTLTLITDKDTEIDDDATLKFDRVDTLNQKSLYDILGDLKEDTETTESSK